MYSKRLWISETNIPDEGRNVVFVLFNVLEQYVHVDSFLFFLGSNPTKTSSPLSPQTCSPKPAYSVSIKRQSLREWSGLPAILDMLTKCMLMKEDGAGQYGRN